MNPQTLAVLAPLLLTATLAAIPPTAAAGSNTCSSMDPLSLPRVVDVTTRRGAGASVVVTEWDYEGIYSQGTCLGMAGYLMCMRDADCRFFELSHSQVAAGQTYGADKLVVEHDADYAPQSPDPSPGGAYSYTWTQTTERADYASSYAIRVAGNPASATSVSVAPVSVLTFDETIAAYQFDIYNLYGVQPYCQSVPSGTPCIPASQQDPDEKLV